MTVYATPLNQDINGKNTSSKYADRGDGVDDWHHYQRVADGGQATIGAKADAAISNPATSGSVVAFLKGILTQLLTLVGAVRAEDSAAASGDVGIATFGRRSDTLASTTSTDGDYIVPGLGQAGEAFVTPSVSGAVANSAPTNASTTAYATSKVVKASAGTLYGAQGYNSDASAIFIQLHNATSLPSNGATPEVIIAVPAASNFSIDFGVYGRRFGTGITIAASTTGATLTVAGSIAWIDAQYK